MKSRPVLPGKVVEWESLKKGDWVILMESKNTLDDRDGVPLLFGRFISFAAEKGGVWKAVFSSEKYTNSHGCWIDHVEENDGWIVKTELEGRECMRMCRRLSDAEVLGWLV